MQCLLLCLGATLCTTGWQRISPVWGISSRDVIVTTNSDKVGIPVTMLSNITGEGRGLTGNWVSCCQIYLHYCDGHLRIQIMSLASYIFSHLTFCVHVRTKQQY